MVPNATANRIVGADAVIDTALLKKKKRRDPLGSQRFGTPERIRTAGLPLRRRTLYPAELQTQIERKC